MKLDASGAFAQSPPGGTLIGPGGAAVPGQQPQAGASAGSEVAPGSSILNTPPPSLRTTLEGRTPDWIGKVASSESFGYSIATGDINGDGYPDLVVGAPLQDSNSAINDGALHVFYGTASGLPSPPGCSPAA